MNTSPKEEEKTVGQYSYELQQKGDQKINPIDLQREIHKGSNSEDSYEDQVRIAVQRGEEQFEGDFFVVVLFKKERLLKNVVRQYFFPRESCPTPEFDQVVYQYLRKPQELKLIWVIPDQASTRTLPIIQQDLPEEQKELIQYINDFNNGKLDEKCALLNKEI